MGTKGVPLQILQDMQSLSGIHIRSKFYTFVLFLVYCIIFSVAIVLLDS